MITLLVNLLVLALVIWVVFYIVGMLPLPEPAKMIVQILFSLVALIVLLNVLGIYTVPLGHVVP